MENSKDTISLLSSTCVIAAPFFLQPVGVKQYIMERVVYKLSCECGESARHDHIVNRNQTFIPTMQYEGSKRARERERERERERIFSPVESAPPAVKNVSALAEAVCN